MTQSEYLTVAAALTAVLDSISVLPSETVALPDALGRVLATPIVAQDNLPPFANSAMDGYAVCAADVATATRETPVSLRVLADIAAGSVIAVTVTSGTAVRIMTGAPLPAGADAVVPVEDSSEPWRTPHETTQTIGIRPLPPHIHIYRAVQSGDFVRLPGEDIQAGQTILTAGHVLRPQEIAVLASLGMGRVPVIRCPRVAILATGDELIPVEAPLTPGKIRNSNGYAQMAQVAALGAIPIFLGIARDTEADVQARLQKGLAENVDLFISSAGVSVGAYDVVKAVLAQEGHIGFWRVRMRPGKPLAYGRYRGIPYLGLPGNPVSAMVSFERFARPAILKMGGHTHLERPQLTVQLQEAITSDGRESYIRAIVQRGEGGYTAVTTGGQGSHLMTSLVKANALLIVPEGVTAVPVGDTLQAMMIDWPEIVF